MIHSRWRLESEGYEVLAGYLVRMPGLMFVRRKLEMTGWSNDFNVGIPWKHIMRMITSRDDYSYIYMGYNEFIGTFENAIELVDKLFLSNQSYSFVVMMSKLFKIWSTARVSAGTAYFYIFLYTYIHNLWLFVWNMNFMSPKPNSQYHTGWGPQDIQVDI